MDFLNYKNERHLRPSRENANWTEWPLVLRIAEMGSARNEQPANKMAATEPMRFNSRHTNCTDSVSVLIIVPKLVKINIDN